MALSKRATRALEILKAGGCFVADPEYGGTYHTLHNEPRGEWIDGFGRRGFAKAARRELIEAGYRFDEELDGRNFIIEKLIGEPEVTS